MSENIVDIYTEKAANKILKAWYPYTNITVNEAVVLKLYEIIESTRSCTTVVSVMEKLVGGPIGTSRSLTGAAIKTIKSVIIKTSEDQHALTCIKLAALAYRNELMFLGL